MVGNRAVCPTSTAIFIYQLSIARFTDACDRLFSWMADKLLHVDTQQQPTQGTFLEAELQLDEQNLGLVLLLLFQIDPTIGWS